MNRKKIAACAAAMVMAAGISLALPAGIPGGSLLAVTAAAADYGSDFVVDKDGMLIQYKG